MVDHIDSGAIMTESGEFTLHRFKDRSRGGHQLALAMGEIDPDTPVPGPRREHYLNIGIGAQMLRALGIGKMRLMAAPMKYSVTGFGLEVT